MKNYLRRKISTDREYLKIFYRMLGVTPSNVELYKMALIHRSSSVRTADGELLNNERLEFLGDAILEAVSSELIFVAYPAMREGEMTQLRSKLVSGQSLNRLAKEIGLVDYIQRQGSGRLSGVESIWGDALEALFGALYLDKGYRVSSGIIARMLLRHIDLESLVGEQTDHKSSAIEWAQKRGYEVRFVTVKSEKYSDFVPDFTSRLLIDSKERGEGSGRSKKQSEQAAAADFFTRLHNDVTGTDDGFVRDKS